MKSYMRAVTTLLAVGTVSAVYQQVADAVDRRRLAPPGRVVDIGGRRMHVLAMGDASPTVVIIPALGSNVLEWVRVLRASYTDTTVCVCDRAGLGWSDPPRGPVTVNAMADDLHALLKAAGIAPPYIVAGHSMGGIIARRFRARYPGDVAGMLLIDSSHENQVRCLGGYGTWHEFKRAARRQARILGVRRLAASIGLVDGLDATSLAWETVPEYAGAAKAVSLSTKQRRAVVREILLLARPHGQPRDLGALPLAVLSAGSAQRRQWPPWEAWIRMQDELAALSSDSTHAYAVNAGHNIHLDDPDVVVQAVRELVRRCR